MSELINAYEEIKPYIPYHKTTVQMPEVVHYLKSVGVGIEIVRSAYIMFRNESGNGTAGINNNYIGAQADSGKWDEKWNSRIVGIVRKIEGRTGKERLFLAFDSYKTSLDLLLDRVEKRGIFVGRFAHKVAKLDIENSIDLCRAYYKEWVTGKRDYEPTNSEMKDFLSMYAQSEKIFVA